MKEFTTFNQSQIEKVLSRAAEAFEHHRRTPFAQRAELLMGAATLLDREKEQLAHIITLEMGKLLRASIEEIEKCSLGCRFYAENAERFLEDRATQTGAARSFVRYQPLGPVLAIMPWNFPFWQVFRFAAPALMAGNVGLLKHAANVPQCALAIEDIFRRAGFAEGVFQTLLIETEQTRAVIEDARVKAVTLTGSERAGSEVASAAARLIKKSVLELGGSDPFIVMPSANLKMAAEIGVKARTINSGQSCIAAKRFIVAEKVYQDYVEQFVDKMRSLKIGDPLDPETEMGPLATESILKGVDEQVQKSIAAGAKLLTGGNRIKRDGFFYEPTVLADIPRNRPLTAKKFSVRSHYSSVSLTATKPWPSLTTANSVSVLARGLTTVTNKTSSSPSSSREWFLSTAWLLPIRGFRLAASNVPVSAASLGAKAYANSLTRRPLLWPNG